MRILQIGLGNFGKRHLEAWHRLGLGDQLIVAERDQSKWAETARFRMPADRLVADPAAWIAQADIVDIVTPTDSHFELCKRALEAGKDVFIEKPMTMTSAEARQLAELSERTKRFIQVGYYYRYHPISQYLKAQVSAGRLGDIRYITGNFCGFKRARTDVGVTHTDGIHFLDLFNWLLGSAPVEVYAVCRDHFGRGLEDLSVVLMTYPGGAVGKVESGYVQPGRWNDKVVPGALTTKEIVIVGSKATAEADFEAETMAIHDVHHELRNGVWAAVVGDTVRQPVEPCDPVAMVSRELSAFLRSVERREAPSAGPVESGVHLAALIEAIYESAERREAVRIEPPAEVASR